MNITYGPNANTQSVSPYSLGILTGLLTQLGLDKATISSTARDAFNQARVMYDNIHAHGADAQHELYGKFGDQVIDVYTQLTAQPRDVVIEAMRAKIVELGPANVSHHCADPSVLCVFDVSPSSIPHELWGAFERAVLADTRITRFFKPPQDPGFHLEIPQEK